MPSLKALKTRIASVKSTQQITRAMKLVAAAKMKRAIDAATRRCKGEKVEMSHEYY